MRESGGRRRVVAEVLDLIFFLLLAQDPNILSFFFPSHPPTMAERTECSSTEDGSRDRFCVAEEEAT